MIHQKKGLREEGDGQMAELPTTVQEGSVRTPVWTVCSDEIFKYL